VFSAKKQCQNNVASLETMS